MCIIQEPQYVCSNVNQHTWKTKLQQPFKFRNANAVTTHVKTEQITDAFYLQMNAA